MALYHFRGEKIIEFVAARSTTMPTGTLIKDTQFHAKWSVTYLPTTGPATDAIPNAAPANPWYLPRQRQAGARIVGHCAKPARLSSQSRRAWMPSRNMGKTCSRTTRQVAANVAATANYGDGRGAERYAAIHPKDL